MKPENLIRSGLFIYFTFQFVLCASITSAQAKKGWGVLKGVVRDASSFLKLTDIKIIAGKDSVVTAADGTYQAVLKSGTYTVLFTAPGYHSVTVSKVTILPGGSTELYMLLMTLEHKIPNQKKTNNTAFVATSDTIKKQNFSTAFFSKHLHYNYTNPSISGIISGSAIQPGTDRDASFVLKRLPYVSAFDMPCYPQLQNVFMNGMSERYNQFLLNGLPAFSNNPFHRSFSLPAFPAEGVEEVSVQNIPDASLPAGYTGGTIKMKLKHFPERNFFYLLGGAGAFHSSGAVVTDFFNDPLSFVQRTGFAPKESRLPANFPNTKSRVQLHQYNTQEQFEFARTLSNRFLPLSENAAIPNNRFTAGYGKIFKLRKKQQLGIMVYANNQKAERIDLTTVQASPDLVNNKFPFSASSSSPLIRSHASDSVSVYTSSLLLQTAVTLKTQHARITFRNLVINQLDNSFNVRSQVLKTGEDTASGFGIHVLSEQRLLLNAQLEGEHILNKTSGFRLEWQAGYTYNHINKPDERNVLIMQNPRDPSTFRLAVQSQASLANDISRFTNSGRAWSNSKDHNFNAAADLSIPFELHGNMQQLKAGFFIQSSYRISYSDLFLLTNKNSSNYFSLGEMLAPVRFFPGDITIENYYKKIPSENLQNSAINGTQPNFGNYTASSVNGAVYTQLHNKLSKKLEAEWGVRAESLNQLVSNTQYEFRESFKRSQLFTLNLNSRATRYFLLPSAKITWSPFSFLQLYGAYAKTFSNPLFREVSDVITHFPDRFMVYRGNPVLESSAVHHYHAGMRLLHNSATDFSFNAFYREIRRPVEQMIFAYTPGYLLMRPYNTPPAYVSGVQASLRVNLFSVAKLPFLANITMFGSGTINRSVALEGPVKGVSDVPKHQLSGVPGYVFNAGFLFHHPRWPNLTLLYQEIDDMLYALGSGNRIKLSNGNEISVVPDMRQAKRNQFDLQCSQKFLKGRLQLIAGVSNLLRSPFVLYQDLDGNQQFNEQLKLRLVNNGAFYSSGTDNTVIYTRTMRQYYASISYMFGR
jgi:outer membrane receptor protein involved in Fe transport